MQVGDIVEVEPEELVPGGDALARVAGLPLFVGALYPGDRAQVRITERKKGFARGEVVRIVREGGERRAQPCPVAAECGGCDWTALRLDRQLHWKTRILRDALRRIGKFDPERLPPVRVHPSPLNYRLRSRLQVAADGSIGFFAQRTNRVVPIPDECEVVGPGTHRALPNLRQLAPRELASSVELLEGDSGLAVLSGEAAPPEATITIGPHAYRLSVRSFFQVNRHLLAGLQALILGSAAAAPAKRLAWDLYGGVGFFALPLADVFERVVTVESSQESHEWATCNATGRRIATIHDDVARFLSKAKERPDFLLVDPPRAGLAPEVGEGIANAEPGRVCYLSCDPVTFSRDASRLARRGWTLASIDLIDLFPNTHHIETLASFERA